MSVEAMSWALTQTTGSTSRKAVLLALADRAGFDWVCWPSQATIGRETEMDERSVRRILVELEGRELISRRHRYAESGRRTSDLIQLHGPGITTGQIVRKEMSEAVTTGQDDVTTGQIPLPLPDTGVRGTIIEPSIEPLVISTSTKPWERFDRSSEPIDLERARALLRGEAEPTTA